MAQKKDEGLNGNEKIEQAVCQLQQEPTRTGRGGGGAEPGQ